MTEAPAERVPDTTVESYDVAWRSWTTTAGLVVVILCLVVLAATPLGLASRLSSLRRTSSETTDIAARLSAQLRYTIVEESTEHQDLRSTNSHTALADYHASRERADKLVAQLAAVAPHVSSAAADAFDRERTALREWDALRDARADGTMTEAAFAADLSHVSALRDSIADAASAFDADVATVEADRQRAGSTLVERQELLSSILGPLAILAGAIVAVLASRERRLARALAATYQRERRLRAESEERRVALERVTESKTRLMRGFTHDVKNPLGAADGFLELIQEEIHGPLTESQRDIIGRVRRSLRTALKLVADLLDIARAEAGHIELTFAPTNVCALVVELSEEFRGQAQAKGLELRVDAACEVPDVVTDIARLRQVLGNLISNAVKYTDRGSVAVGVKTAADKFAIVTVTDTGRGIAADKLDLLFEEFVRLDPTAAEGAGVGLAITRRIAHALGAEITVTSELGEGSVFSLKLPMDARPAQTVS